MIEVQSSAEFDHWIDSLRDKRARAKIYTRIQRLQLGNPGNVKPVGAGISEMKIDFGPGYRVYYMLKGQTIVLLLCGGDKSTQDKDIRRAAQIAAEW
jgi:putative addiction module killer protein